VRPDGWPEVLGYAVGDSEDGVARGGPTAMVAAIAFPRHQQPVNGRSMAWFSISDIATMTA
jgi:hypothetical protein